MRQVAHESEILSADGVGGVELWHAAEIQGMRFHLGLRQAVGRLVTLERLGGELAGTAVELAGAEEPSVEEDLQPQNVVDGLRSLGQRIRDRR